MADTRSQIGLSRMIANRGKDPKKMRDDELETFADDYEATYGTASNKQQPAFLRVFDSPRHQVLLGTRGGRNYTRSSGHVANAMTPELPEIGQKLAFVLAERRRRGRN